MVRSLIIVAVVGFVLSTVCFTSAWMLGGPAWRHDWQWGRRWSERWDGPWSGRWRPHIGVSGDVSDNDDDGPTVTRDFPWNGGHDLIIGAPAAVDYTQGPLAKITVTGPKDELDHLVIQDGRISFGGWADEAGPIKVVMTAPAVTHFEADGSEDLTIDGYNQDALDIDIEGSGDVTVKGQARSASLSLSGSGDADLGGLEGDAVKVEIDGSGDATVAPKLSADVNISGSGGVVLLSHPATVNSEVSGSGTIRQPAEPPAAAPAQGAPGKAA